MKKILVVDDQREIQELMQVTLRLDNYQILVASSGKEAIEKAIAEIPDLIFMDIMMPGDLDGLEATRILKSEKSLKDTIIVILSAKGQKTDIDKGMEIGADDYFVKPFDPLELLRKVEEVLG